MNCDKNNRELESLKAYYSHLEELLFSQNENFEFNFDESHNSAVTRLMLENTTSDMCMFCGSMSVFSEEFYRGIGEKNQELADFLKEEMKKTLKKFFISEGKMLRVVLEKKPEGDDFFDSFILEKSVWEKSIKEKKLEISYLPAFLTSKSMLNHFSFTEDGKISRFEQDKKKHSALCTLNSRDQNKQMKNIFKKLHKFSLEYIDN